MEDFEAAFSCIVKSLIVASEMFSRMIRKSNGKEV